MYQLLVLGLLLFRELPSIVIFKFFAFKEFAACAAVILFKFGTLVEVLTLFSSVYNITKELLGSLVLAFGTWSVTKISFLFPFKVKLQRKPAFVNAFCASVTVLLITFGTVIVLLEVFLSTSILSGEIPR